ncbi:MAG: HNH endonuclease signature motif containing protein [Myxococcota bacterium]
MKAWLMLSISEGREHAGNRGYDDDPAVRYSWDSTVANHGAPKPGDVIALWDSEVLLGVSVIEVIEEADGQKERLRCPKCRSTGIKERQKTRPRYRCYQEGCLAEFDEPAVEWIDVHTYRTRHDSGWIDMQGLIAGPTLRALCVHPKSIQSIRELDWAPFSDAIGGAGGPGALAILESTQERTLKGGHTKATVRVRVGQQAFRTALVKRFGSTCAFTGPQPLASLDAAHLYAYADVEQHHEHGGLLLRKDMHRLFDLGWLCIEPTSRKISVGPALGAFPDYARLEGIDVHVPLPPSTLAWLREHWIQHRGT